MSIPSLSMSTGLIGSLVSGRHQLIDLQQQFITGKRATSYGGLDGTARLTVMSMRAQISAYNGYDRGITDAELRLNIVQQSLSRFADIAAVTRTDAFQGSFTLVDSQQTVLQRGAGVMFDEMAHLLNSKVGERYLFSGRDTQTPPLELPQVLLNGDGVRAGAAQLIAERAQADVGAAGIGRLMFDNPAPETVVLAEDGAHPFGFKLGAVRSDLSNVTVTGPAGAPPQIDIAFAGQPEAGETIAVTLAMPDGTSQTLELAAASGPTAETGTFQIGADEAATAANLQAALADELARIADTSLRAASAMTASAEFFAGTKSNPPPRVDGPPFDTATAQVAGTAADTVIFYKGDDDAAVPARQSALVEIDTNVVIGYGTRADEEAVRTTMAALAALSTMTFNAADENAQTRYKELTSRVGGKLGDNAGQQSFAAIQGELGNVQRSMAAAKERHGYAVAFADEVIAEREDVTMEEVAARILTLQTRLQASMQATSLLSRLTLTNFM